MLPVSLLVAEKELILPGGPLSAEERATFDRVMGRRTDALMAGRRVPDDVKRRSCEIRNRRRAQGLTLNDLGLEDLLGEMIAGIGGGAAHVTVTLDTTGPAGVTVNINGGAAYATSRDVTLAIGTSDGDTTGYTMKIYGDVDDAFDTANYRATEGNAPWISYATSKSVRLANGDGSKTVRIKVRDDVWNVSSEATDAITLDTSLPVVTVQGGSPDVSKISKIATKDTVQITWQADQQYDAYKVKVVPATGSLESAGTQIPTTAGSTNVGGSAGDYPATTNVTTTIKGTDLETASAGDGAKIIKIFVQDDAGNWSV